MFFIFTFVSIINFCVEKTEGNCQKKCSGLSDMRILDHLPTWNDVNELNEDYNVHVSESVEWSNDAPISNYNEFTVCDNSVEFLFTESVSNIVISSNIQANDGYPYYFIDDLPAPIKFNIETNISILYQQSDKYPSQSIVLKALKPNLFITAEFVTNNFETGKIRISEDSNVFNMYEINDNVKSAFESINMLTEIRKSYYCISDKAEKCVDYAQYNPKVINSPSEIEGDSVVLIVESQINQIYSDDFKKRYIKFIGLDGSHIIYKSYTSESYYIGSFHVIINQNDIAMTNSKFEGQGSFTLAISLIISLCSTTEKSSIKFTLKRDPESYYDSHIYSLVDNSINLENKIQIPDLYIFWGEKDLSGLFEEGKYVVEQERLDINNILDLQFPNVEGISYYFADGDYEIPSTWNKRCTFRGERFESEKVNLIFKNVHSFSDNIDNIISLFWADVILYPTDFISFSFPYDYINNIQIVINGDVIFNDLNMHSDPDDNYGRSEYNKNIKADMKCHFSGSGRVKFIQSDLKNQVESRCTKDETVIFEDYTSQLPDYYICVGQSNLEECKAEIENVESITDGTWIWLVKIGTASVLRNVKRIYITDEQMSTNIFDCEIVLTKNADFTVFTDSVTVNTNSVNKISAQTKTAKLLVIIKTYYRNIFGTQKDFSLIYEAAPTEIDFRLYFDEEIVNLFLNVPSEYVKNSINIEGNCAIYVRNYLMNKVDVFKKPDSIVFIENTNPKYECLCLSENIDNCFILDSDFLQIKTLDEIVNYDIDDDDGLEVYVFNSIELSMDINLNPLAYLYLAKGSSLTLDVPDKGRILIYLSRKQISIGLINQNIKSMVFLILDESVEITFKIKNSLYLDVKLDDNSEKIKFIPKIKFETALDSIEIIPCIEFNTIIHKINQQYKITIPEGISILSPMPEYLESIFDSKTVTFSGTCVYLNEEGKSLCGSKNSKSFEEAQKEDINTNNIVITTGIDSTFSIPSSWGKEHYLFFIRPDSINFNLTDVSSLSYYSDGLKVNDKSIIVAGNVTVFVPPKLTFNVDLPKGFPLYSYMYFCYLDCGSNEQTNLYGGYLSGNQIFRAERCIHVGGYDIAHKLTVYFNKEEDLQELYGVAYLYGDSEGMNYKFGGFDYICFALSSDAEEKCTEPNYYLVSDISTLISAVNSYPDLTILVTKNLEIPDSTGKSFNINASNENIEVIFPSAPKTIEILEDNQVKSIYEDSTFVIAQNKMSIAVSLEKALELSVSEALQSKLTFSLNSNVLISTKSSITQDFTINVVKNGFHLYADDVSDFGSIFGNAIEVNSKICAYETNADSLCTYNKKDTIENVFKLPFDYNDVEIAISSNSQEITFPSISREVNLVLRYEDPKILTINSVSDIQITNKKVILNENWIFNEKADNLLIKLNKQTSISISETSSLPITLQLTDANSIINLKDCVNQNNAYITLNKFDDQDNTITVLGSSEVFENFKSLLVSHEGITIKQNDEKKHFCICKDDSCNKCKEGIEGLIDCNPSISSDPGENVEIRVFMDIEVASTIFTNEHNVFINPQNNLNIKDVQNVYQNIENKLKVDKLILPNGNNLLIKPKPSTLYITMAKQKAGVEFTIEFSNYLVLNVPNAKEDGIVPSKIKVKGNGELNLYDYPSDKVEADSTVKVIKGIYIICNSKAEGTLCSYHTTDGYKVLNNYDNFDNSFDKDSKILVILDSYTSILDVEINRLHYQQLMFITQGFSLKLLASKAKVRFLSTDVLTNKADSTTNLDGTEGGISLSNNDADNFIVAFNEKLTIKQEGNIDFTLKPIVIQPTSDKASIVIDKNVQIEHQQIRIETEKEKLDLTVFVGDRPTNDENINKFLDISEESKDKVKVIVKEGESEENDPTPKPQKKGLKTGEIVGIVIGVVAFVAIVVVVVIIIVKKKKNNERSSTEISDQE